MALSFLYRFVRRVIAVVWVHRMDAVAKDAEILVCAISWPCSSARSPVPASLGQIEPS